MFRVVVPADDQPDGLGDPDDLARRRRRAEHRPHRRHQDLNARTFRTFEYFAIAAVIYYLIAKIVTSRRALLAAGCSGTEGAAMFNTAFTLNDLVPRQARG